MQDNRNTLYLDKVGKKYTIYRSVGDSERLNTQIKNKNKEVGTHIGSPSGTKHTSLDELPNGEVSLHLAADLPQPVPRRRTSFEILASFSNQPIWKDLQADDDGE